MKYNTIPIFTSPIPPSGNEYGAILENHADQLSIRPARLEHPFFVLSEGNFNRNRTSQEPLNVHKNEWTFNINPGYC